MCSQKHQKEEDALCDAIEQERQGIGKRHIRLQEAKLRVRVAESEATCVAAEDSQKQLLHLLGAEMAAKVAVIENDLKETAHRQLTELQDHSERLQDQHQKDEDAVRQVILRQQKEIMEIEGHAGLLPAPLTSFAESEALELQTEGAVKFIKMPIEALQTEKGSKERAQRQLTDHGALTRLEAQVHAPT